MAWPGSRRRTGALLAASGIALSGLTGSYSPLSPRDLVPPLPPQPVRLVAPLDDGANDALTTDHIHRILLDVAQSTRVPPPLLLAVAQQESQFDPSAISDEGAIGLMQLTPHGGGRDAFRRVMQHDRMLAPADLRDPIPNAYLGATYLRYLIDRYDVFEDDDLVLATALAAYNAGPTCVSAAIAQQSWDAWNWRKLWAAIPGETRHYIRRVFHYRHQWQRRFASSPYWLATATHHSETRDHADTDS